MEKAKIGGIMQSDGRAMIKILSVPDHVGVAAGVLGAMGRNHINIELLVQSFDLDDDGNFSMVIDQKDLDLALTVLDRIRNDIDARAVSYAPDVAVITVFAPHLREKPFVHGTMFATLAAEGIRSMAICTSISSISCVVEGRYMAMAVGSLEKAFITPSQAKHRPKDY